MTRLTDGKRIVDISMRVWNDDCNNYSPDWSADFFNVGSLLRTENGDYIVKDVDYCIEQAFDWENGRGDFADQHNYPEVVDGNRYVEYRDI